MQSVTIFNLPKLMKSSELFFVHEEWQADKLIGSSYKKPSSDNRPTYVQT